MCYVYELLFLVVIVTAQNDADAVQMCFKNETQNPRIMTTSAGAPVDLVDARVTLNLNLISNEHFMDSMMHFVRERIPERVVHAQGSGAFGYFEVTHNIRGICKAKLFDTDGKTTPIAVRFSTSANERGGIDTIRDARGFAIKFYSDEGNFDIAGFDVPVFSLKDPLLFPDISRAQRRNPATHLLDNNMVWDYITLQPESLYIFMLVFADRGIPDGYRHMPGYSIHTYELVNEFGEKHFARFQFMPEAGLKNLTTEDAIKIGGVDPDYAGRDLYNAIRNENYPSWNLSIQLLTIHDVNNAGFDVFDITKVLPFDKYPLRPLGRIVLNKNPTNYFADIEQLAFCPGNLVPGILGSPDKVFEARRLAYREAQHHRLGANFMKISVNCPLSKAFTYNRDGSPPVRDNEKDRPNYYPNSFNGPVPYKDDYRVRLSQIYEDEPNNFDQVRSLYENEMTEEEISRMFENMVASFDGVSTSLRYRAVKLCRMIHPDLGNRLAEGLGLDTSEPDGEA